MPHKAPRTRAVPATQAAHTRPAQGSTAGGQCVSQANALLRRGARAQSGGAPGRAPLADELVGLFELARVAEHAGGAALGARGVVRRVLQQRLDRAQRVAHADGAAARRSRRYAQTDRGLQTCSFSCTIMPSGWQQSEGHACSAAGKALVARHSHGSPPPCPRLPHHPTQTGSQAQALSGSTCVCMLRYHVRCANLTGLGGART